MPAVETRLWDGPMNWSAYANDPLPIQCAGPCGAQYPTDHPDAPTGPGGYCRVCAEAKGAWSDEIVSTRTEA